MSIKSFFVLTVACCSTLGTVFAAPVKSANPIAASVSPHVDVWIVKQTSYNLGDVDIILAKDAVKWHNNKLGLTLLLHAPDWKLNAYNDGNKKFLVLNRDEALELFQHQRRRIKSGLQAPLRIGDRPAVAGMPTVGYCYAHEAAAVSEKFAIDVTRAREHGDKLNRKQQDYFDDAMSHQRREYWLAKSIVMPPKVSGVFMEKVVSTKFGDNLPLRLVQFSNDGSKSTMFDTKAVQKGSVSGDFFKMPAGYTRAENKIALLVNDNELNDELGGDSDSSALSPKSLIKKHEETHR
jgi:hypothetical protein